MYKKKNFRKEDKYFLYTMRIAVGAPYNNSK